MARPAILFVCLGNICRSPLAEAALRAAADRRGIEIEVDSAGLGGWHKGDPPDRRAQAVARRHGIDISAYQARQVGPEDFARFDLVIGLDEANLAGLRRIAPAGSRARVSMLLDHVPGRAGQSVEDPYFGDAAGFDITWADVTAGAEALLDELGE